MDVGRAVGSMSDWIDGTPYARLVPSGIAKLDPITGTTRRARCGWTFGLSPTPFEAASDSQSVCDEE